MGATRHSHCTLVLSEAHLWRALRGNGSVAGLSQSVNGERIVGGREGSGEEEEGNRVAGGRTTLEVLAVHCQFPNLVNVQLTPVTLAQLIKGFLLGQ